jgi:hypothetical protein
MIFFIKLNFRNHINNGDYMKKFLLFCFCLIPYLVFSQYVLEPGYKVSFQVTPGTLGRTDSLPCWSVKGGFDINKNGKKEILLFCDPVDKKGTKDTTNTLYLLENDGLDNYKVIWSWKSPYRVNSYGDVMVADVDKDNNLEIWMTIPAVATNIANPPRLICFEYDGTKLPSTPTVEWAMDIRNYCDFRSTALDIDDIDNDGDVEIAVVSRRDDYAGSGSNGSLIVGSTMLPIEQGGLNIFQVEFIDTTTQLTGGGCYDVKIVDFDGDGKKEIWVMTWDKFTLNIYEATGINQYPHQVEIRNATPTDIGSAYGSQFYDVNKDGKLEYFCAGANGEGTTSSIVYIANTNDVSKLTKSDVKEIGYKNVKNPLIPNFRGSAIGDFDKDGKMDFVTSDRPNYYALKLEYNGSGNPADSSSYTWSILFKDTTGTVPYYNNCAAASADMDGDGYQEILLANYTINSPTKPLVTILEATKTNGINDNVKSIPIEYSLGQNYPNPFNPSTTIEYSIPKISHVEIKVYDILGKLVCTLVDELKNAGRYSTYFNANDLSSGLYYYQLKTDEYSTTKKMMYIR